jgi:hypothetical protein
LKNPFVFLSKFKTSPHIFYVSHVYPLFVRLLYAKKTFPPSP